MLALIHFVPVEVKTFVRFVNGNGMQKSFVILTIVLIPRLPSGRPVITHEPFPEIYL